MDKKNIQDILPDFPFVIQNGLGSNFEWVPELFFRGSLDDSGYKDEVMFLNDLAKFGGLNYIYKSDRQYYCVTKLTPMSFIVITNCTWERGYAVAFHKEELALLFKLTYQ